MRGTRKPYGRECINSALKTHSLPGMLWAWKHRFLPYLTFFFLSCPVYNLKVIEITSGQWRAKDGKPYRGCQATSLQLASSLPDEDGHTAWPLGNNWFYNIALLKTRTDGLSFEHTFWFYNTPLLKTRKDGLSFERKREHTFSDFLMNCSPTQNSFLSGKRKLLDSLQQSWQCSPLKNWWPKWNHWGQTQGVYSLKRVSTWWGLQRERI